MKDPKKALVAEFYKDFDEMDRDDLLVHLIEFEGCGGDLRDESLEYLQKFAWGNYANNRCGLDMHEGVLMQFGDGGYPYLYTAPADGGDSLCHVCATKALKKGEVVGWMHHMEGETEHCDDCWAQIKPFVEPEVVMHEWVVTLRMRLHPDQSPDQFDWAEMLDLGPNESCEIEACAAGEESPTFTQKIEGREPETGTCQCTEKRTISGNRCTNCHLTVGSPP